MRSRTPKSITLYVIGPLTVSCGGPLAVHPGSRDGRGTDELRRAFDRIGLSDLAMVVRGVLMLGLIGTRRRQAENEDQASVGLKLWQTNPQGQHSPSAAWAKCVPIYSPR